MGMYGVLAIHILLLVTGLCSGVVFFLRKKRIAAVAVLALTPLLMTGWYFTFALEPVTSLFFKEDTIYSAGYTERMFKAIALGTSRTTVVELLGAPLTSKVDDGREYLYYSRHGPRFDHYRNRIVILDARTGSVIEKFHEFYVD